MNKSFVEIHELGRCEIFCIEGWGGQWDPPLDFGDCVVGMRMTHGHMIVGSNFYHLVQTMLFLFGQGQGQGLV